MGRSTGEGQERQSSTDEPGRRSTRVRTAVAEAVLGCIEADDALTYEEILDALLGEAAAITGRLRRGQATPASGAR